MAGIAQTTEAIDSDAVLRAEGAIIGARRGALGQPADPVYFGIGLSGGGIRSATFNLGILQGLARADLLPCVDYLSTVSGGGYIGTWLHALIKRRGGNPADVRADLERPDVHPHMETRDPIFFLRKFSSYLAPDVGLLSADTWVIAVIWMRNMLLNQLILIPFLACLSLLVFLAAYLSHWYGGGVHTLPAIVELAVASVLFAIAASRAGAGAGTTVFQGKCNDETKRAEPGPRDSVANAVVCAVLVLAACFLLAAASQGLRTKSWASFWKWWPLLAVLGGVFLGRGYLLLQHAGKFDTVYRAQHEDAPPPLLLRASLLLVPGLVTGFLFFGIAKLASGWSPPVAVAWATPLFVLAVLGGEAVHIGLMGIDYPDDSREWLARVGGFISIFAVAWAALFAIAVFGPLWIAQLAAWSWRLVAGLGTGWIATSLGGVLAGRSTKTTGLPNQPNEPAFLRLLTAIAPSAFMLGYLLSISFGLHRGIIAITGIDAVSASAPAASRLQSIAAGESALIDDHSRLASAAAPRVDPFDAVCLSAVGFLAIGGVIVLLLPLRININEFSMNHFYKNRLVRCYLGAVRKHRVPSRLTGFDSCDDIPLAEFLPTAEGQYYGPFPIINTCLNLNTGSELAKRERKGTSFVFTPLYTGFVPPRTEEDDQEQRKKRRGDIRRESFGMKSDVLEAGGFRPTKEYAFPGKGPDIGSCMAISGAAANPNGGFHTAPAMAFLMTVFNVRLGWWVGNPRLKGPSKEPGPRNSLLALLSELFAQTDARSNFLNLSDGGHFENLGLYELIRRRCRYIIVGDGEQDVGYTFESLGGAIRKCRADFGVEIDIDPRRIHPGAGGLSGTHCVVGRIRYPPSRHHGAAEGWLLYLKASLTGDEPEDIAQYKSSHGDFPQQTTVNQFFTESQFESYRKLGLHVWESAVQNLDPTEFDCTNLNNFFECLYRTWYPPVEIPDGVASKHNEIYSKLVDKLSDPALSHLMNQVIAPRDETGEKASNRDEEIADRDFLYALELIQLMENVWGDLRMFEKSHRESPANGGWVAVFAYWTHQPLFQETWKRASYTFNPIFQQFYNTLSEFDVPEPSRNTCGKLPWSAGKHRSRNRAI